MATHNGASYVVEQLRSILVQLSPADEVVVVDDASSDDTVAKVEQMADPRVRVVRLSRNVGHVATFEHALRLARGELIFLSDQDDVWPPGRVAAMQEALADHAVVAGNLAVLGGPERLRGPFGEQDWRLRVPAPRTPRETARLVVRLAASDVPYFGSAMALRRDALDLALPFPPSVRELHDAWLALIGLAMRSMGHIEERVVLRREHGANTSGRVRSPWRVVRGRWYFVRMCRDAWRRAGTRRTTLSR